MRVKAVNSQVERSRYFSANDVGVFAPLYVNHLILQPGECCFYAAEELHAYLSGECVECVGCSNNTIRAALTPKFIDRETLVEVLNYRMTEPDFYLVPPRALDGYPHVVEYAPDCKDFTLHQIKVSGSGGDSGSGSSGERGFHLEFSREQFFFIVYEPIF